MLNASLPSVSSSKHSKLNHKMIELKIQQKELQMNLATVKKKISQKKRHIAKESTTNNMTDQLCRKKSSTHVQCKTVSLSKTNSRNSVKINNQELGSLMYKVEVFSPIHLAEPEAIKSKSFLNRRQNWNSKYRMKQKKYKENQKIEKELPIPKSGAFRKQQIPPSAFPSAYNRGEIPIAIDHRAKGNQVKWLESWKTMNLRVYVPLFFEGIREQKDPYKLLARQGLLELLKALKSCPRKIAPVIPDLVRPIRTALSTRHPEIFLFTLKALQALLDIEGVGEELLPLSRQFLQFLNMFKSKRRNIGDSIDFGQRGNADISQIIRETLELLEIKGGHGAFGIIKYMVPTYESCVCRKTKAHTLQC